MSNDDYVRDAGILGMVGLALGAVFGPGSIRRARTKQEKLLERLDEAERTAKQRAASPAVAAAEAKRLRKAEKLKRLEKK